MSWADDDWLLIAPPARFGMEPVFSAMRIMRSREWKYADDKWFWARFTRRFEWAETWDGWDNPPDPAALMLVVAALRAEEEGLA